MGVIEPWGVLYLGDVMPSVMNYTPTGTFTNAHSPKSAFATLFLKLHEMFISWAFVRIYTIL